MATTNTQTQTSLERPKACDNKILNIAQTVRRIGLSKPTIYRLMNEGEFPRPIRLSKARVAWLQADLEKWLESRPTSEGL